MKSLHLISPTIRSLKFGFSNVVECFKGPPVLGSERVAMRTMEQLKQDVDDDDLDEIDEEEEGDFDELE